MLKVLCVDDNHDAADSEAMLLELYGWEVAVCYDGATALLEAANFHPDACLIDYNMPGMNGCELAQHLRAREEGNSGYLILVTAHAADSIAKVAVECGFDLHMVKPVDWEDLTGVLAKLEGRLGSDGAATESAF